jgi:transcriptional regulator with XRE-family HTH domain
LHAAREENWETRVEKRPNPTDRHVGARVRMRRILMTMSQEKLGEALGVTFQQVQKYEKGVNRISASRLQQIAETLGVTPAYFFEGAPGPESDPQVGFAEESVAYVANFLSTSEGLQLNRAFARIRDARVRRRIVDLVVSLAERDGSGTH